MWACSLIIGMTGLQQEHPRLSQEHWDEAAPACTTNEEQCNNQTPSCFLALFSGKKRHAGRYHCSKETDKHYFWMFFTLRSCWINKSMENKSQAGVDSGQILYFEEECSAVWNHFGFWGEICFTRGRRTFFRGISQEPGPDHAKNRRPSHVNPGEVVWLTTALETLLPLV